ncbi:MAG: hypothetical protein P8177_05900 [Gemmatimonadota bacterium]|jgi:hypothetical protein
MALSELLWACPRCGRDRGLDEQGVCAGCGAHFRRGRGARIVARLPDGEEVVRPAADWVDALPDPASILHADHDGARRSARGSARSVSGDRAIFGETGYLNRVELYGEARPVVLALFPDHITVTWHGEGEETETWSLEDLTAVQASSRTLQLKARGRPLTSFRFDHDSVYLWEALMHAALRDFYGRTGRGVIVEFQPRIVVR